MRIERRPEHGKHPAYGALVFVAMLLSAAMAALWLRVGLPRPVCLLREWTGLACPTCGSTRAIEALFSGDLAAAAAWNPLLTISFALAGLWALASAIRWSFGWPGYRITLTSGERRGVWLSVLAVLAAGWVYLVARGV